MRLVIVSGVSGSGKTVALHTLEDGGFYCVDNLPASLLPALTEKLARQEHPGYRDVAVGIDIRGGVADFHHLDDLLGEVGGDGVEPQVLFLTAERNTLLKRFSETRRKHPLSTDNLPLGDAVDQEVALLEPLKERADLVIDTTGTSVHDLRRLVGDRLIQPAAQGLSLLIQSFGFKHGVPADSDFVFDARCLPNPHWNPELRPYSGLDAPVRAFLESHEAVDELFGDIHGFLEGWLPRFEREHRSYLTVSIGCTGGQHRSVYLADRIHRAMADRFTNIAVRHRDKADPHKA